MKNLLKYSLFESSGFDYVDLKVKKDYKSHLEFAFSGMAKFNEERDFVRWCVFKAYSMIVLQMDVPTSDVNYIEQKSKISYPDGFKTSFDFSTEIEKDSTLGTKSVNWFLKNFLANEMVNVKTTNVISMEVKKAFISAVEKSIKDAGGDAFLPGNLNNLQKLKYLDYIQEYTTNKIDLGSLKIDQIVSSYIDASFYKFVSLYPAGLERDSVVGERLISMLKLFANHNLIYFKNLKLPDSMAEYVVKYFNLNKESFKTADELRKSNVGIYNRIKELLPNVDTAADLGDLGF